MAKIKVITALAQLIDYLDKHQLKEVIHDAIIDMDKTQLTEVFMFIHEEKENDEANKSKSK